MRASLARLVSLVAVLATTSACTDPRAEIELEVAEIAKSGTWPRELSGAYHYGPLELELRADGTYECRWSTCCGYDCGMSSGAWRGSSNEIAFFPSKEEGLLVWHLRFAYVTRDEDMRVALHTNQDDLMTAWSK